jgi:DNA-directed RNA polymerase subunit RPC12/RpoP
MFETGEAPGAGAYYCTECYKEIRIDNEKQTLPECPVCSSKSFEKAT